ncbi:hypothetical protein COY59_02325 [Candidatus Gottesmanbacteria bacterium CG_4_10_14_0_8_um_filter_37_24]|uniref:Peptidase family U32 C-terminal domain-containing protein n=1 Tax=Candidatus Gottesmanbacteria bacterium CG_4_10_14_0_8_um_filter_37_24 TaxID=1974574 RepID=A0A2M7RSC6_9BACT|nr:MAG: hypothetical protein COX23_04610 [Candidatus Gottesmanbacteria bacterium CG23_combo_of_CG06-09_8_20_14_all_37_19]PIZ02874.1 MAG: hypothetical protein COY59_02325 [Candidatus Gottesmanbacteria bacterium CG_4_10_14_0_8_um_filter_37_24]
MAEKGKEIGHITHFFDKITVAVISLKKDLKVGDTIRLVGVNGEFTQVVSSMQVDRKSIEKAKKGLEVAIKVDQAVNRGWKIFEADK